MMNEILEILIVEDNIIIQQVIELCLISLGYAVCGKVASGEAAIDFIKKRNPMLSLWISPLTVIPMGLMQQLP